MTHNRGDTITFVHDNKQVKGLVVGKANKGKCLLVLSFGQIWLVPTKLARKAQS